MNSDFSDPVAAAAWQVAERKKRGWSTTNLADYARAIAHREGSEMKLTQQSVSGFETTDPDKAPKRIPEWFRYVRMAFEEGAPDKAREVERRDEIVYVRQFHIRYSLGNGSYLDENAAATLVPFNLGFIRGLTKTPTDKLFLAEGFGDSMEPIIHKHDLVLIDTDDRKLELGDTSWALEYAGAGYIKRLRSVMRDGKRMIMILSANPDYPPEMADPQDVRIIGKVVWIARRM